MYEGTPDTPGFAVELEALDPDHLRTRADREIDWSVLQQHMNSSDTARFAGRFFCGHATTEEIAEEEALCLWAHGEGGDAEIPQKIFPIQRANAKWQAATKRDAKVLARLEAKATLDTVVAALKVGDLLSPTGPVVVYLETAPGRLSPYYWRYWAKAVRTYSYADSQTTRASPFMPGIICDFELVGPGTENPDDHYWPEGAVREALGAVGTLGPIGEEPQEGGEDTRPIKTWIQPAPFSMWARKMPDGGQVAPLYSLGWFNKAIDIPTHFRRIWDCAEDELQAQGGGLSEAQTALLKLVTIDESTGEDGDTPLDWALEPNPFYQITAPVPEEGNANDARALLMLAPAQTGIDYRNPKSAAVLNCTAGKDIVIPRLPSGYSTLSGDRDFGTDFTQAPIRRRPSFVGRYLAPRLEGGGVLTLPEAEDIVAAGMQISSFYQQNADPTDSSNTSLRRSFENAMKVQMPAFAPIYFAVDIDVDGTNYDTGAPAPTLQDILTHFRRIRWVYQHQYINQPGAVPYYIGVYGPTKVLHALYRAGLATHFWQLAAATYGQPAELANFGKWFDTSPGWRAWPHLNAWQIRLAGPDENLPVTAFNPLNEIRDCKDGPGGDIWCDLDVAWGNSGSWVPTKTTIPVLPEHDDGGVNT